MLWCTIFNYVDLTTTITSELFIAQTHVGALNTWQNYPKHLSTNLDNQQADFNALKKEILKNCDTAAYYTAIIGAQLITLKSRTTHHSRRTQAN